MNRKGIAGVLFSIIVALFATFYPIPVTYGCTRAVYLGPDGTIITGRSMDWEESTGTDLWAFPAGMKRDGATGETAINWVSKYGSVACSFYNASTVDGMNEKGLVANVLYLAESEYGKPDGKRPTISIAAWAQYVLDSYATVSEAVDALRGDPFVVIAPVLPNGRPATGHLAISDPTGDSAIFEYIGGKLFIHHGKSYQVMTNSPVFDKQLALNEYWEQISGATFLPGTTRASDRFARASFYINAIPKTADVFQAVASVFGVIRGVSVPLGITTPGEPNIASTYWRTLSDQKDKIYYFDSATSPTVFWVPLSELDLKEGAPIKKLPLVGGQTYSGNAASRFEPAQPFGFLQGTVK
ncbi:MAG: linear amide C-N hydrolase [Deltaproteobacteria bacterium]|nr:linear amide C-N hydrolase [Deltaproteobacteria bacterium]